METLITRIEAAGGIVWAEGNALRYRIPADAEPLLSELRQHKTEILRMLRQPSESPADWAEDFHKWAIASCRFKDRCFGDIEELYADFCHWTSSHESEHCTRATFEDLLRQAGFLFADGSVSGLLLASSLPAEEANRLRPITADGHIVIDLDESTPAEVQR